MYNTSADDLARIASDLSTLATTYTNSAQQLDQEVTSLDGAASQLINGGPENWVGQSSEAFLGAWGERKARMQQASQLLTQSAQHLKQLAQTIDEHLPTIRADQSLMANSAYNSLAGPDQQSVLNEDSQAQNAIITALNMLNSQLESLAEEIGDCPQEHQDSNIPGSGDVPYNQSNSNDNGGEGDPPGGWTREPQDPEPPPSDTSIPPFPTSESTPEVFENDGNVVSLYPDGELQVGWIEGALDDSPGGRTQFLKLRALVKWLGNRVRTITGYATDAFRAKYFATDAASAASMQRFNAIASTMGFQGTYEKVGNMIHITFTRI